MKFKLQSAMEYLMTYGWAILIIAVVLGVLFSIGVFSGSSFLGTACVAASGYLCSSPIYSHTTGNVVITFGQNTGTTWNTAEIAFVNQTVQEASVVSNGLSAIPAGDVINISGGLISGQSVTVSLPAGSANNKIGTPLSGYIWVGYTTPTSQGTTLYTQVATITVKST